MKPRQIPSEIFSVTLICFGTSPLSLKGPLPFSALLSVVLTGDIQEKRVYVLWCLGLQLHPDQERIHKRGKVKGTGRSNMQLPLDTLPFSLGIFWKHWNSHVTFSIVPLDSTWVSDLTLSRDMIGNISSPFFFTFVPLPPNKWCGPFNSKMWGSLTTFPLSLFFPILNSSFIPCTRENYDMDHVTPVVAVSPWFPSFIHFPFPGSQKCGPCPSPTSLFTIPISHFMTQQFLKSTLPHAASDSWTFPLHLFSTIKVHIQSSSYITPCPGITSPRDPSQTPSHQAGFGAPLFTRLCRLPLL